MRLVEAIGAYCCCISNLEETSSSIEDCRDNCQQLYSRLEYYLYIPIGASDMTAVVVWLVVVDSNCEAADDEAVDVV